MFAVVSTHSESVGKQANRRFVMIVMVECCVD